MGGHNLVIPAAKESFPELDKFIDGGSVFAFSDLKVIMGQHMGDGSMYVFILGVRGEDWMREVGYNV